MLEAITIFTLIVSLSFLAVIFFKGERTRSMFSFLFILFSFIGWTVFNYLSLTATDIQQITFWMRLVMLSAAGLMLGVFELANYFPQSVSFLKKIYIYPVRILFLVVAYFALTDRIILSANFRAGQLLPIFGDLIFLFLFSATLAVASFALIMRRKYRHGNILLKRQIKYIAIGLTASTVLGILTNLVFVLMGVTSFVALGPSFVLILISFLFLLLINGQLFNVRIFAGRATYYAVLGLMVMVFYYTSHLLDLAVFKTSFSAGSVLIGLPISVIFIIVFNSVNRFIQNKVDSTFINPDYDPKAVISTLNKDLSTTLDINQISKVVINTFATTLRSSYEGIVLFENNQMFFYEGKKTIALDKPFIEKIGAILEKNKTILNIDTFENDSIRFTDLSLQDVSFIINQFSLLKLKIVIPLFEGSKLNALILLGQKEGGWPYGKNELDFIKSVADISSLALTRSFLYKEVQEFNQTLQLKIDNATLVIQDKNKKLEQTLTFERDMLDILGHELRTPLGIARNAILLIQMKKKEKTLTDEDLDKQISVAVENIRREVQLLETILASTKLDNNKLELNLEKVDIIDVINDSIDGNISDASKKGLKLYSTDIPKTEVWVKADRLRIQQVIDNLLSNAVKYTKEGEIKVTFADEGSNVKVSVTDTGEGIQKEDIPNLGKKFFRINNYLPSAGKIGERNIVRSGGTGIGLYVVFQLMAAMNGKIVVESEFGKGSTFSFIIPKFSE